MGKVICRGAAARLRAIEILQNGGTLDDAAAATGYGRDYVRQLGAKEGIRFPRGKYGEHKTKKYDSSEIGRLYLAGKSVKDIIDILGVKSANSVYSALHEQNIELRKGKEITAYVMRLCKGCNTIFLCHPNHNQVYCSIKCQAADSHNKNGYIRRIRATKATIDHDITLKKVAERDRGICWLCGEPVDWNDYELSETGRKVVHKMYPSVDHVVALCCGGSHSWENVRLAHVGCNARKGVKSVG